MVFRPIVHLQVSELQQTRTVLVEVAFPLLNCQAGTEGAATAVAALLSSHGTLTSTSF